MTTMFEKLLIRSPDSLGDIFVYSGVFHHFIQQSKITIMGVNDTYLETAKTLYQDFPNVNVVNLNEFENAKNIKNSFLLPAPKLSMLPVQYGDGTHGSVFLSWDQQVYNNYNLPFSLRYTNFKMPKHIEGSRELYLKLTEGEKDYIVVNKYMGGENNYVDYYVHQFNPENFKVVEIKLNTTNNVLQYVDLLKNAKQIHVLPTSIHQLVESMINEIPGQLFLHHARRNFFCVINNFWNNHRWNIINYEKKW